MNHIIPFEEMKGMADAIAKSKLFGMQTPEQVLALMAIAQAEGLHPAMAARDYHIIQGRPALKADAMLARFQSAGGKVEWKDYTDEKVTGIFSHPNGGSIELTWTIEQAKRIGLAGKDNWAKYPRAMLRARVVSEGIRTVFPGCVVGTYTPEEIQDFDSKPQEVDVTPTVQALQKKEVNFDDMKDDNPFNELSIPIFIPGSDEPYAQYATNKEWMTAYTDLYRKIWTSTKYSVEDKGHKLDDLRDANIDLIHKLSALEQIEITKITTLIRKGE